MFGRFASIGQSLCSRDVVRFWKFKESKECNHGAVVDAIHAWRGVNDPSRSPDISSHMVRIRWLHCYASAEEEFRFTRVRHGSFSNFNTRSKGMLLKRPADGVQRCTVVDQTLRSRQQTRERQIHAERRRELEVPSMSGAGSLSRYCWANFSIFGPPGKGIPWFLANLSSMFPIPMSSVSPRTR